MLEIKNLTAGYGELITLRQISIHIKEKEFVGVVGANAAGKTTLSKAISGLLPAISGEIFWYGQNITKLIPSKRPDLGLVMVPEGRNLFGYMTVEENLELGATNIRAKSHLKKNLAKVYDLFEILSSRRKIQARALSGGQQQMLAIGRALMAEPLLLILDEPSVGLAPMIVAEIYVLLKKIFNENTSILLIEQDVTRCLNAVQRAYVMSQGRIVIEGQSSDLINNQSIRETYLGM